MRQNLLLGFMLGLIFGLVVFDGPAVHFLVSVFTIAFVAIGCRTAMGWAKARDEQEQRRA